MTDRDHLLSEYSRALRTLPAFARAAGITLRPYQRDAGAAIVDSVMHGLGRSFVIIFPRQSGKDELMANLVAYLMACCCWMDVGMVEVNPTYKPQTINAIMRLENRLSMNFVTQQIWSKRSDFKRMIGLCQASFLSGDGEANVVGATASLLMFINEAQDIEPAIYDKKFEPMRASSNSTAVFCGTVWTSNTLLARETRHARLEEEKDGIRRVYFYTADDVGAINKSYARFVAMVVKKHGRQNPLVRTQYFCEEIDAQAGLFNTARRALMMGDRPPQYEPTPGVTYAFLIDVAGQDEAMLNLEGLGNPGRDSTTLSIIEIDLSSLDTLQAPTYRVVHRETWTGVSHLTVFGQIKSFGDVWSPEYIVVDATGVGEGLFAMLNKAFPNRVTPVKFTQQEKSEIGYGFISIIETGRFHDCVHTDQVRAQYAACFSEILPGPAKTLRWGVKDGTRDADGQLVHDDYILADSLVAVLDRLEWTLSTPTTEIKFESPLKGQDKNF